MRKPICPKHTVERTGRRRPAITRNNGRSTARKGKSAKSAILLYGDCGSGRLFTSLFIRRYNSQPREPPGPPVPGDPRRPEPLANEEKSAARARRLAGGLLSHAADNLCRLVADRVVCISRGSISKFADRISLGDCVLLDRSAYACTPEALSRRASLFI